MNTTHTSQAKTIVIKVGTDTLNENDKLSQQVIQHLADQIAELKKSMYVILVTSGAIGAGRSLIPAKHLAALRDKKQALSGLGQTMLMDMWRDAFAKHTILCGQGLVIKEDCTVAEKIQSMQTVFRECREIEEIAGLRIVPVINGNDFVSYGPTRTDNDEVAGAIAFMVKAEKLLLLTNVDGLFTGDPSLSTSELIRKIDVDHDDYRSCISADTSAGGTGGMLSKYDVAVHAAQNDIVTHIGNGKAHNAIRRLIAGNIGTRFHR